MLACECQYGVKIEVLRHLGGDILVVLHQEVKGFVCTEFKNCLNFHIVISVQFFYVIFDVLPLYTFGVQSVNGLLSYY